jgi:hypothetical protein
MDSITRNMNTIEWIKNMTSQKINYRAVIQE